MKRQPCKSRLVWFWRNWGVPILTAIVVMSTFRSAVADWNHVPTGSMKPNILEGDRIFVNKLAYDLKVPFTTWHCAEWAQPKRGDVVVLFSPEGGTRLVKRVIGVPGDRIEMRNNRLLVNAKPASYSPIHPDAIEPIVSGERTGVLFADERIGGADQTIMIRPSVPALRTFAPMTLGPDEYFVLGDNRDGSRDSRYFGTVKRSAILGRATHVAFSLRPDHYYLPRFGRLLHPIP